MFSRLGPFIYRQAKIIVLLAVILVIAAAALGVHAFGELKTGGFDDPGSQSVRAANLIDQKFGGSINVLFLVHTQQGNVDAADVTQAGTHLTRQLAQDSRLNSVVSYWQGHVPALRSHDGSYAVIAAHIKGSDEHASAVAKDLQTRYQTSNNLYSVSLGGPAVAGNDIGQNVGKSLGMAEGIAIPLTLLFLTFAFGTVVSALLPLMIGLVAILGTFAELFVLGKITDVSIYAINLTTALGLGLAVDYALFIVSRYREELSNGSNIEAAITKTIGTAGRTVLFSASAVIFALAAMMIFPLYFLRSFAYAGVGVVIIAALSAIIFLPAVLVLLKQRTEKGRLPWAAISHRVEAPFWRHVAGFVMRHPALTALPAIAVLLLLASPLHAITFGTPDDRVLRQGVNSRQVGDIMRQQFNSNTANNVQVVLRGESLTAGPIGAYAAKVSSLPGVQNVATAFGIYAGGQRISPRPLVASASDAALLSVSSGLDPQSNAAEQLVTQIRALPPPSGDIADVGGVAARLTDTKHAIGHRLPLGLAIIAVSTCVILFLFSGSIVQPLRALVTNGLTLAASIGIIVWIFQLGHFTQLLSFAALPTNITMPILLFCIAFGLSMDYEVFLLSRIKEQHDAGADNQTAVAHGLARAGRIVSTAAIMLAISFFAFATASISFLQLFGIGTGLAILFDATLVRGILVPAFMRVVGERSWYAPKPLKLLYGKVGLHEG